MTPNKTRGVRNNNPGNIDRHDNTKWQGMADDQSSDPRFVVFKTAQYGIRALAKVLLSYEREGFNTINKIFDRYAPPIENDTTAYKKAVADQAGFALNDVIDVDQMKVMEPMVNAIIAHECAGYVYPVSTVRAGLLLAGIADAPPVKPPLHKDPAFLTKVGGAATIAVTTTAQYAPQAVTVVHGWRDQLQDYVGVPIFAHAVQVLTILGGVLVVVSIAASVVKQRRLV